MEISYLGHASHCIESEKCALIIDPWFSTEGAFLGSWHQFPRNHECLPALIEKTKDKRCIIFVTHSHEDHFDKATLRILAKRVKEVKIPCYSDKTFLYQMQRIGFDTVTEVTEEELVSIGDITFRLFIDDCGINQDSAILVEHLGFKFLNLNDCKIQDRADQIKDLYGPIDVLTQQFSGAVMHPICYDYSPPEYQQISNRKRLAKMNGVYRTIKKLSPRMFFPSAGPAAFLSPALFHLNFEFNGVFPKSWDFCEFLRKKDLDCHVSDISPGGKIVVRKTSLLIDGLLPSMLNHQLNSYLLEYQRDCYRDPEVSISKGSREALFRSLSCRASVASDFELGDIVPVYFSGGGLLLRVCLVEGRVTEESEIQDSNYYLHTFEPELLALVTSGKLGWGDYFLSFRFKNKRVPDTYNTAIDLFLTSNNVDAFRTGLEHLQTIKDSTDTIEVLSKNETFSCKRRCPHQGADLKYAQVVDGKLICPRHYWQFDLKKGGKCTKNDTTISSLAVTPK